MDKHDIQYAERTMRHIRGVQDHMLYLLANHSVDLELTKEDEWELLQNAIKHDLSKWTSEQFKPYVDKFTRKVDAPDFDAAWRAHYMTENHHYENGRWLGKLEVIEICCDLQAMADEFGEGSAFVFWDSKWRPKFINWLNDLNGPAGFTDVRRQMTDVYQFHTTMMHMQQIFEWLNERRDNGEMPKGMNLVKALQILEQHQAAMWHAKFRKFSDDEMVAILTYRQAIKPND